MKKLITLAIVLLSAQAMSATPNFGKFKVSINNWEAVILLNSNGDVLEIENDDYMTIDASNFFGETTLHHFDGR